MFNDELKNIVLIGHFNELSFEVYFLSIITICYFIEIFIMCR